MTAPEDLEGCEGCAAEATHEARRAGVWVPLCEDHAQQAYQLGYTVRLQGEEDA